ncbi:MAG: hypothetical protein SH807_04545 [Blastochloris sp.]|jgi:hypothetical protein|nr:hypothetical protein [Blastochloris sp.]
MWKIAFLFISAVTCSLQAGEHIFVSGGPALRYFERHKDKDHDKYWGNFIVSVVARQKEVSQEYGADDLLTWLIYKPAHQSRDKEEKVDFMPSIIANAAKINATLIWFSTKDELINYINTGQDRSKIKIERFEYFGHSNKRCFMFDYSNKLDGAVPDFSALHLDDLKKIKPSSFDPRAHCQSWGCHSGEEFSRAWFKQVKVPMLGAIGKTDYSKGGVPHLSTQQGRWAQ